MKRVKESRGPADKGNGQIPRVIHYCWFGGNPLPELAVTCIASWRKYLPDYEIKEWNESNFNLDACDYVKEAYQAGMWAFVSDYARFKILYESGGLYFDTDVELIKPVDDILERGGFMGSEASSAGKGPETGKLINAGLGLASLPANELYREVLHDYEKGHFIDSNGIQDITTVVVRLTGVMIKHGYNKNKAGIQIVGSIMIYPPEYFCPLNYYTGELVITENTRSIHHYSETWHNPLEKKVENLRRAFARAGKKDTWMEKLVIYPLIVLNSIRKYRVLGTCMRIARKVKGSGQ